MSILELGVRVLLCALSVGLFISILRSARGGAPFIPMWGPNVREILALGAVGPNDVFVDCGCGDGRAVIEAVRTFGVRTAIGYDISRVPVWLAQVRAYVAGVRHAVSFHVQDARVCDLSRATVVYMYLLPKLTNQMAATALLRLAPGSRVITACFSIDDANRDFRCILRKHVGRMEIFVYERVG